MRYRKLSPTGDYTFGNGQQDFWRDVPEAVGQAVQTRLLLWLGEWFLDIEEGTPFMQGILGKYSVDVANTTVIDRASETQGLVNIQEFIGETEPNARAYGVEFAINTIYGPTQVQVTNYANY